MLLSNFVLSGFFKTHFRLIESSVETEVDFISTSLLNLASLAGIVLSELMLRYTKALKQTKIKIITNEFRVNVVVILVLNKDILSKKDRKTGIIKVNIITPANKKPKLINEPEKNSNYMCV